MVELMYFNAGGGHRASALALEAIALAQRRHWNIRLVNIFDVLDPRGHFHALTGLHPEDLYNKRLARGWTRGMAQELRLLQQLIRLSQTRLAQRMQQHWQGTRPDLVVSLVPNFNRVMATGLRATGSTAPYVTVMTDLADMDHGRFWIEPGLGIHLVCGTAYAAQQASRLGLTPTHIHTTSGMLVRPEFYQTPTQPREQAMLCLGLDPARPTALALFGGHGGRAMLHIARGMPQVQTIFLCGHNHKLAAQLQAMPQQAPRWVQGFTPHVANFMHMADFMIGKPGPGSISEALRCGLPVIVMHNGATMPQERYNVRWVQEQGVGLACTSLRALTAAVAQLQSQLPQYQARVRAMNNRALFEVPDILERLLQHNGKPTGVQADAHSACHSP
ncbi:galactosyldiacylglycerol synthase [Lampropedia puyangensis]|uniref:Galactosyldiacylglycerol synthase n=2 Tax=Lampropedia puyangensis TaxID=1330072 RepID=A0A4S8EWH2_9BURK|nr:galactosyldiacylglycerol synthase [Lampropedia puyangensis]